MMDAVDAPHAGDPALPAPEGAAPRPPAPRHRRRLRADRRRRRPPIPWSEGRAIVARRVRALRRRGSPSSPSSSSTAARRCRGPPAQALAAPSAPRSVRTTRPTCSRPTPETGRDVATLAHELGHAVHYSLARRQTFLHYEPPLVLAETASVFAEMLVTDHLLARAADPATRRRLLVETLDEIYGTVFRQHALTRFEMAAHAARRDHRLDHDELCDLWMAEQSALFRRQRRRRPGLPHRLELHPALHPQPLLLLLLRVRRAADARALPALQAGRARPSCRPISSCWRPAAAPRPDLAARLGFDLASPTFWDGGCATIAAMVDELERELIVRRVTPAASGEERRAARSRRPGRSRRRARARRAAACSRRRRARTRADPPPLPARRAPPNA